MLKKVKSIDRRCTKTMKTLDGLLSSSTIYYKDLQTVLQKKLGPGTIEWDMHYLSYFHNGLTNIYDTFNRGLYSLYTNENEIIKGKVLLRNATATPPLSLSSISTVVPYSIYTNTFQNKTMLPKIIRTSSLRETVTNIVQTQVTARYNLGDILKVSINHSFSIPFSNLVKTSIPVEFEANYNLSKETATITTTFNTLMIPEQTFTIKPMNQLIIDILLLKVHIPSTDILLQAEMFGPINLNPAIQDYLSETDIYTVMHTLNTIVPNVYFNKPDPYIFDHSPLELVPNNRTVKLNSRSLLQATLTSHQYIVHIREIPLLQKHDNDFITDAYVETGTICKDRTFKFKNHGKLFEQPQLDITHSYNDLSKSDSKCSLVTKKQKTFFCSTKCFFLNHTQSQYLCRNPKCSGSW